MKMMVIRLGGDPEFRSDVGKPPADPPLGFSVGTEG